MKKRLLVIASLAASLVAPSWAQDLVLGLSHAKTGRYSGVAVGTEIAVDIAVAEINAAGGINGRKIRVEKFDTGGDPKNAQVATQKFAEDVRALGVIGPFSSQEALVTFNVDQKIAGYPSTSPRSIASNDWLAPT